MKDVTVLFFIVLYVFFQRAMYLRELRPIMLEKLLADYLHGVDIYLKTVRNEADHALKYVSIFFLLFIPL